MLRFICRIFGVFALVSLSVSAIAQNASVSGLITDPSGAAVRNARVTLVNELTAVSLQSKSNESGLYTLPFVQPGKYTLRAQFAGFEGFEEKAITIQTAQTLTLDVRLRVGSASETVKVDGSGIQINTTDGTVSTVVDQQFVENLPMNGRSFQSLLTAVPGVVSIPTGGGNQWSVNGQRVDENYFTIDGVSANAGYSTVNGISGYGGTSANFTAVGTTQSMLSIDAMDEFRASTSNYSAEYGRAPGGQFTITSRAGTNNWHGSTYDYFRNDAMDSNNWFNGYTHTPAVRKQAERQNDFGGTFGGPVRIPLLGKGLDKTFFFASYEALVLQSPNAEKTYYVPSNDLRKNASPAFKAYLAGYPTSSGPDLGGDNAGIAALDASFSVPSRINATSFRLDHKLTNKINVFGRYQRSPSSSNGYCVYCYTPIAEWESKSNHTTNGTMGVTTMFSPRIGNDLRMALTQVNSAGLYKGSGYGGSTPYDFGDMPGYVQGQWKAAMDFNWGEDPELLDESTKNAQRQGNIVDSTTMNLGRHTIKFGVDFRRTSTWVPNAGHDEYGNLDFDGVTADNVVISNGGEPNELEPYSVVNNVVAPLFKVYQFLANKPQYYNTGLYVQDEWRAMQRLSLSLGLRWDIDPAPSDGYGHNPYTFSQVNDLVTLYLVAPGQPLWETQWKKFAPRLGFAYRLNEDPSREAVVRAGIGLFYDTSDMASASSAGLAGASASSGNYGCSQPTASNNFTNGCWTWPMAESNFLPVTSSILYPSDVDPKLKSPYTVQWNVALQQELGAKQSFTMSWVANVGQDLIRGRGVSLGVFQNPVTPGLSGGCCTYYDVNGSQSNYNAMQVQFQRRLSKGLQLLAGYTWAHGFDDATGNATNYSWRWETSDYDIRQNFEVGGTYELPGHHSTSYVSQVIDNWNLDLRLAARTAPPQSITGELLDAPSSTDGEYLSYNPNLVAGQPIYLYGSQYPGGKRLNFNAFTVAKDASGNYYDGDFPRNGIRAFGIDQTDLAVHKDFPITEGVGLQFRGEAFNVFNRPMFGPMSTGLSSSASFGLATTTASTQTTTQENSLYQTGGPRSLQLTLKVKF